jgi:hypothetical protein
MDLSGVSQARVFGLGIAGQWGEGDDFAPKCCLSNASGCSSCSGADVVLAEEPLA